jgi:uncharacterized protein (DUF1697 family)
MLVEQLHHLGVINIGAAGTFVIRQRVAQSALRAEFAARLPFESEIMICDARDVVRAFSNPALERPEPPGIVRFMSVLSQRPRSIPEMPIVLPSHGRWSLQVQVCEGRLLIGRYRRNMKAIRYLSELDHVFGFRATTRSWNTVGAIVAALGTATPERGSNGGRRSVPTHRPPNKRSQPTAADAAIRSRRG